MIRKTLLGLSMFAALGTLGLILWSCGDTVEWSVVMPRGPCGTLMTVREGSLTIRWVSISGLQAGDLDNGGRSIVRQGLRMLRLSPAPERFDRRQQTYTLVTPSGDKLRLTDRYRAFSVPLEVVLFVFTVYPIVRGALVWRERLRRNLRLRRAVYAGITTGICVLVCSPFMIVPFFRSWLFGLVATAASAVACGIATARIAWKVAEREEWPEAGRCEHCGYDLTGNVSGVCPECGTGIAVGRGKAGHAQVSRSTTKLD